MKKPLSLAAFALSMMMAGCKGSSEPAPAQVVQQVARKQAKEAGENLSALKGAVMKGGQLRGGDAQGRPLWSVAAREIRTAGTLTKGTPQQATLVDARATLYRAGKPESTLRSAQMTLFSTSKGIRLEMRGGVTGETVGPWTGNRGAVKIAAPRADVDVQKRVIAASGGVRMSQGALKISGQTLRAQISLEQVDVTGQVRATNPDGQIEAKTAFYDWKNSKVRAQVVTAKRQNTTLTGDVLSADTNVESGTLSGHVVAKSESGNAKAPRLAFDWKRDRITSSDADFSMQNGTGHAQTLQTDSKLRVSSASGLTLQQDGATLIAAFADGFDNLSRLRAREVRFSRADAKLAAPRVDATKVGAKWVLMATGGARGENSRGQMSAPSVTWNEAQKRVEGSGGVTFVGVGATGRVRASRAVWDDGQNRVTASGGVTLEKDGATLSGATLNSDTKFQNAILSGQVRGKMADGSTLQAGTLQKRGDRFFASNGATGRFNSKGAFGVLTIKGAKIEAADDGSGAISSAVATGGVTVTSASGATAHAPRAIYSRKSGKITATGGVDFFDPARGQRLHGDTLVADVGLKSAKLSNARGQGSAELFRGQKLF